MPRDAVAPCGLRLQLRWYFAVVFVWALTASLPVRAGPGSYAFIDRYTRSVVLRVYFAAPQSCWEIGSVIKGAPAGKSGRGDIPVTVTMRNRGGCKNKQGVINGVGQLGYGRMGEIIRIFFVAPNGHVAKVERVAIESAN